MIDPTFRNIDRLFALSLKNGDNDPKKILFISTQYYMTLARIKDFNALIDNNPFFDKRIKKEQEAYEKLPKMQKNDDYPAKKILNFSHHKDYHKFIGIDLSRQTNKSIPQHFNFQGMQQRPVLNFSLDSIIVTE